MEVVTWLLDKMQDIITMLDSFSFAGAPLGILFISCVLTSMVISVFWKGARG